eukprot:gb/GFBE01078681.1/.p1 GENE.gb/GFBE01078681.1/~~gb/GFBE01078681.1/.p1  ORF type:complete len:815 (+),score=182.01 gb/GFBE01078681.1/:1-2445(+)
MPGGGGTATPRLKPAATCVVSNRRISRASAAANAGRPADDGDGEEEEEDEDLGELEMPDSTLFIGEFLKGASLNWGRSMRVNDSWHYGRIIGLVVLICLEVATKSWVRGNELTRAAPIENMRDQIFPSIDDYHEKMDEGLEMMLFFEEFQDTEQVVKHLSWFQTFCANAGGMEVHAAVNWLCFMKKVKFYGMVDPATTGQPGMNCSHEWVRNHGEKGDFTDEVPLGTYPKDIKIDDTFAAYPFLSNSPFWDGAKEAAKNAIRETAEEVHGKKQKSSLMQLSVGTKGHLSRQGGRAGRRHRYYTHLMNNESSDRVAEAELERSASSDTVAVNHSGSQKNDGHSGISKFSGPMCTDPVANHIFVPCKNHNWGPIIYLCRPQKIEVSFHIDNGQFDRFWSNFNQTGQIHTNAKKSAKKTQTTFVDFKFTYEKLDTLSAWYQGNIRITTGDSSCYTPPETMLVALLALLISARLVLDGVCSLLYLPLGFYRMLKLRQREDATAAELWEEVDRIADPLQGRRDPSTNTESPSDGLFLAEIFLENAIGILLLAGRLTSFWAATISSTIVMYDDKGIPMIDPHDDALWKKCSMWTACQGMNLFGFLAKSFWTWGVTEQNIALALAMVRINSGFRLWESFAWWPAVITKSCMKILVFTLFFVMLVSGFAVFAFLAFGARFLCFFSVLRAIQTFAFYTFGQRDPYSDHVHTYEEADAFRVTMLLTIYQVLVVTIALNFFLVIIMNAHEIVVAPGADPELVMEEELVDLGNRMMHWLFPNLIFKAPSARDQRRATLSAALLKSEKQMPSGQAALPSVQEESDES